MKCEEIANGFTCEVQDWMTCDDIEQVEEGYGQSWLSYVCRCYEFNEKPKEKEATVIDPVSGQKIRFVGGLFHLDKATEWFDGLSAQNQEGIFNAFMGVGK